MKKKLLLVLCLAIAICAIFAISASAVSTTGNIDYDEKATLSDGTVLPIYDSNKNPLVWYISGTEEVDDGNGGTTTKNLYSSVIATATSSNPQANGDYLSIGYNNQTHTDAYGNNLPFKYVTSFYVKNGSTNVAEGKTTIVVANLRGCDIGCIQGGILQKLQYIYLPDTMIRSGDYRSSYCIVVDFTQCVNLRAIIQCFNGQVRSYVREIRMPTITPVYDEQGKLTNPLTFSTFAVQSCSLLTSFYFPATTVSIDNNAFQNCSGLTGLNIPDEVTTIGNDTFYGCSGLTYLNFGENSKLTSIGAAAFSGCSKIEGVYLPDCLESFGTNTGSGRGSFNGCSKIWFKNYANETTKPDVYYFPSSLTGEILGEQFKNCKVINSVLVFPSGVTGVSSNYAFNGTGSNTIVFMGDVSALSTNNWSTTKIIFANPADTQASDIATYTNTKTTVFCASETDASKHLESPRNSEITPATCYSNKAGIVRCFCNLELSRGEYEGTMLTTHNYVDDFDCTTCNYCENYGEGKCDKFLVADADAHNEEHDVIFANGFTSAGVHNTYCSNATCKALTVIEDLDAMFTHEGYSFKAGALGGIDTRFKINSYAMKLYEQYEGVLHFGIVIANASHFENVDVFIENGELTSTNSQGSKSGIIVEMTSREYDYFNCYLDGFDFNNEKHTALGLIIAGYVYGEDESDIAFIQKQYTTDSDDNTLETPYTATVTKGETVSVVNILAVRDFVPIISNDDE